MNREDSLQFQPQLKHFIPIDTSAKSKNPTPFATFKFRVSKSFKNLYQKAKRSDFDGAVLTNSVYCTSPGFLHDKMEILAEKNGSKVESFMYVNEEEGAESSEETLNSSSQDSCSPPSMVWHIQEQHSEKTHVDNSKLEVEMMKERFSKLLLGEDMSGCGNGVCTALSISNAITNLCASIFGQIWRLEPLPTQKRFMWRREMEWLLCVSDYIVELTPSWQTFPDGTKLEVMTSRPRLDLYANLPALRKLDNMLLEILDSFRNTEFWYVDQGIVAGETDGSSSFHNPLPRQEDKWWLPVPRVPIDGLSETAKKELQHKRDCTNQILKAAMAINSNSLAEMEVPESYMETLPKNGKSSLGDLIHRYITSDQFAPEYLLECLDLSSEQQALDIANRVESSIYVWRRKPHSKSSNNLLRSNSKSSWEMVKDLVGDADKREVLADRAESLLLCLKQRFPGLRQTTLDMSKIQYNKDVGKSILESYSRVLESLAFNIVARIDDLMYVDDLTKHSDQFVPISKVGIIAHRSIGTPLSVSGSTFNAPFTTPTHINEATGDRISNFGFGVKKMLTDYWGVDSKGKDMSNELKRSGSFSSTVQEVSATESVISSECLREMVSPLTSESLGEE